MFCLQAEHWRHLFPQLISVSILCTAFHTWSYRKRIWKVCFSLFPAFMSHLLVRCIHPLSNNCSFHTGRTYGCCAVWRALVECYERDLYGWRTQTLRSITEHTPAHTLRTQSSMHTAMGAWRGKFWIIFYMLYSAEKTSIVFFICWCHKPGFLTTLTSNDKPA